MYIVQKYKYNGSFNQYIGQEWFETKEEANSYVENISQYGIKCYISKA